MATIVWSMNDIETARIIAIMTSREPVLFCSGVLGARRDSVRDMRNVYCVPSPGTPGEITSSSTAGDLHISHRLPTSVLRSG